jgi:DNA-binding IclR family transcriptional regulator
VIEVVSTVITAVGPSRPPDRSLLLTPLLRNMVLRGYVVTGPDGRSFQLGPQVLKLVQIGCIASDLAKEATSCLQQATRDSGETSAFNQLSAEA